MLIFRFKGRNLSIFSLVQTMKPKGHFEIKWPLYTYYLKLLKQFRIHYCSFDSYCKKYFQLTISLSKILSIKRPFLLIGCINLRYQLSVLIKTFNQSLLYFFSISQYRTKKSQIRHCAMCTIALKGRWSADKNHLLCHTYSFNELAWFWAKIGFDSLISTSYMTFHV